MNSLFLLIINNELLTWRHTRETDLFDSADGNSQYRVVAFVCGSGRDDGDGLVRIVDDV